MKNPENTPLGSILTEILDAFKNMIRSEIHLAKVEAKAAGKDLSRHGAMIVLFAVVALSGILPLIAFAVIGLGRLFGDNYWLSSLVVGVLEIAFGGILAYRYSKRIRKDDLTLPHLRENLREDRALLDTKIRDISEATKRRVSTKRSVS